jgi:hypothetical protein
MTTFQQAIELGKQWASSTATYEQLTGIKLTCEWVSGLTAASFAGRDERWMTERIAVTEPKWVALLTQLGHPVDNLEFHRGFASGLLGAYPHAIQRHLEEREREAQRKPIRDEVAAYLAEHLEDLVLDIIARHHT